MYEDIWGAEYLKPEGYIAGRGSDAFEHKFGGDSWEVADDDKACGGPTLLLALDLKDERLSALPKSKLDVLPLCSYINGNLWTKKQTYRILPAERRVELAAREETNPKCPAPEDMLPTVLNEIPITLRPMLPEEYAADEDTYYSAYSRFMGGNVFIRVLGTPLWVDIISPVCECSRTMDYVASIGNEVYGQGDFANGEPFFIGEGALYFYFCPDCLQIQVHSQGT